MENFILTFALLVIGVTLRRSRLFPKETATALNLFVIYVSLPALILLQIPEVRLSKDLLAPALMPWAMLLVSALLVLGLGKFFAWERTVTGAMLLLIPLGNTSFLGIPVVKAFFGEAAIPYAVLYDQLGSFLALATYGSVVLALYGTGDKPSPGDIARRILTFPPFIALCVALLAKFAVYPAIVQTLLQTLASTLVPVVMIAVGFQLTFRLAPRDIKPLAAGLAVKLVVAPFLALFLCRFLGLDSLAGKVSVFEAGMPPMVSAGALAIIAGLAPELTASFIGLGILASFATLPLLFHFL